MGDAGGPYLFDVGVVVLAHADTPVSDRALSYVRDAISNAQAARLMRTFMDAKRIHWHADLSQSVVRDGFRRTAELNIDGWDGYYAAVALAEGVNTILTLDDDFDRLDGVSTNVILSPDEFERLNDYLSG